MKIKSYRPDWAVDILPATSRGVHWPFGTFFERKIRIACKCQNQPCSVHDDPLCAWLEQKNK